jgi:hypothetical protein
MGRREPPRSRHLEPVEGRADRCRRASATHRRRRPARPRPHSLRTRLSPPARSLRRLDLWAMDGAGRNHARRSRRAKRRSGTPHRRARKDGQLPRVRHEPNRPGSGEGCPDQPGMRPRGRSAPHDSWPRAGSQNGMGRCPRRRAGFKVSKMTARSYYGLLRPSFLLRLAATWLRCTET